MGYGYSESVEEVDLILIIQLSMSNFDLKRTKADMTTRVLVSGTKVFLCLFCLLGVPGTFFFSSE